jgi:hypothetical protein
MKGRLMIAGTMPLAPASLVGPLAIPAVIIGGIVLGIGTTLLILLSFAVVGAVWLAVGSLFYLLGSGLRSALKVDRHASALFATVMAMLKPLVLFYTVAFVAIQFWPHGMFTQIIGWLFALAVLVFWLSIFFGGLLSAPDEALA